MLNAWHALGVLRILFWLLACAEFEGPLSTAGVLYLDFAYRPYLRGAIGRWPSFVCYVCSGVNMSIAYAGFNFRGEADA